MYNFETKIPIEMVVPMKVFFGDKQNVKRFEQGLPFESPSARKPQELAELLKQYDGIEFIEPQPLSIDDFKLCHDPAYVDGVMSLQLENGFGSRSQAICDSLPYTNGAMYDAALAATIDTPTCALVSGFHHAGYHGWAKLGYYCTFNGLMITACKLLSQYNRVAIIDADMHWGNGTDSILSKQPNDRIYHFSFGRYYTEPKFAWRYLDKLGSNGGIERDLTEFKPSVILYQAGADVHVDDPFGGVLTTEEMYLRDYLMFSIAKRLQVPIVWNLAGGYQVGSDGSIDKVLELHLNTFKACQHAYSTSSITLKSAPL